MGSREVSATVMAFKSPAALAVVGVGVLGIKLKSICCRLGRFGPVIRGGSRGVSASAAEFFAEKPNGLFFNGCGSDEGELRERFNIHEVMGFSLSLVHEK